MPHRQRHRGPHPKDARLFAPDQWPALANATRDLHYLLSRDYGEKAAIKAVGDRYRLVKRQRYALRRIASSAQEIEAIRSRETGLKELSEQVLFIDGFNLLILAEVALCGGYVFECLDGTFRDIASVHGSYHRIAETPDAVLLIGQHLQELGAGKTHWYLDKPVSNSGKLGALLRETAQSHGWSWTVELAPDVDRLLVDTEGAVIATSDRVILRECQCWINLSRLLAIAMPAPTIITLHDLGIDSIGLPQKRK